MTPDYAQGFDAGERQAFDDRIAGRREHRPGMMLSEAERGWWDGYCPRGAAWWTPQPHLQRQRFEPVPLSTTIEVPWIEREAA